MSSAATISLLVWRSPSADFAGWRLHSAEFAGWRLIAKENAANEAINREEDSAGEKQQTTKMNQWADAVQLTNAEYAGGCSVLNVNDESASGRSAGNECC